jgi:WD40 repeat protein
VPKTLSDVVREKYGWVQRETGKSVTELEMLFGVLLMDPRMKGRSFFYVRDPKALDAIPEPIRSDVYVETDPDLIVKLAALKQKIRAMSAQGYPVFENYPARWNPALINRAAADEKYKNGRLEGLEAFGRRVSEDLWRGLCCEYPEIQGTQAESIQVGPWAEEEDLQERFIHSRLRVYVGREQINDALLAFAGGNDLVPCLVTGRSGSGKSAALARFVRDYQHKQPQTLVIPHFIGASPRSTNLRDMLRRFCQVLKARFGFAEDVPEEVAKLSVTFRDFVGKVPADTRVLLVIDALNQLDEADRAQELYWLPTALPPQVKVIVSCITDSGKTEPVQEAFRWRKHSPVQLTALTDAEQRLIIRQVPSLSAKTLDDDQVRLLLSNPATANPLFLLAALEELRGFASYERLNERIAAFPREGDTVTAIFTQVIERLTEEFNEKLVETVLTLLASARRGLSERELQELVAGLDGADDLFPVLRQLRPHLLSRAGLIDFYHRNLFKAVRELYLPSQDQQRQAHVRLAEYFNAQGYWLESLAEQRERAQRLPSTPRPANVRKVDELPWQLLQAVLKAQLGHLRDDLAADYERVEKLFTELHFLEAKNVAGKIFDLAAEFSEAVNLLSEERPQRRILRLLNEALRRDIHFIARHAQDHPQALFQCLWNTGWWYDCPQAAAHYVSSDSTLDSDFLARASRICLTLGIAGLVIASLLLWLGFRIFASLFGLYGLIFIFLGIPKRKHLAQQVPSSTVEPLGQPAPSLAALLEKWRATKEEATPGFIWLRSLRPPESHLGAGMKAIFCGHESRVEIVVYSPDGLHIASGSLDQVIRIWDAATGVELICIDEFKVNQSGIAIAYSPDGRRIAASVDKGLYVWDSYSGLNIRCFCDKDFCCSLCLAYSPDGRCIAGCIQNLVRIWNLDEPTGAITLRGHEDFTRSVAFAPDGRCIATGSHDKTVRVWNAHTGEQLLCLVGHERLVSSVSFSPDGRRIATGSYDCTLRIWDVFSGDQLLRIRLHGDLPPVTSVTFSPDGQRIVSGSFDGTVRIWDAHSGAELFCLRGHEGLVNTVAVSPDGCDIISGGKDGTVRIWNVHSGTVLRQLQGHKGLIRKLSFSPNGLLLISGSVGFIPIAVEDTTIRVWDAKCGVQLLCIQGPREFLRDLGFSEDGKRIVARYFERLGKPETGEAHVWKLRGLGDATAVTTRPGNDGSGQFRAVCRKLETLIEVASIGEPLAWLAGGLQDVAAHPSGRTWAGSSGKYLCLFTLEGEASPTS